MKKVNIKAIADAVVGVIGRFYPVLIFVLGVAVMAFLDINRKDFNPEFYVWAFFMLGTAAMLPVSVLLQQREKWLPKALMLLAMVVVVALYCFVFLDYKSDWGKGQFALMMAVSVLSFLSVLYVGRKQDISFWVFTATVVREVLITGVYMTVLFGGLSLAIYATDVLFGVNVSDKFYANLSVCCYLIIAPFYFLSNVPKKDDFYSETIDYHKFLKILGLYVLLPVLAVYVVILYVYLLKIVITWQLPDGWVTTLVSVLALGGYAAKFILFPVSENSVVKFLNRYFSLLLLPLIVLMSVGLARRFSDYGITINRLYVLVFNVWLYGVSIYLFITQSRHLRWLVVSFTVVLFAVSVGPWSVFSVTRTAIQNDLNSLLTDNKLLHEGKLVCNTNNNLNVSDSISEKIHDKIYYYIGYYGIENWKESYRTPDSLKTAYDVTKYIGVDNYDRDNEQYVFISLPENRQIPIQGYTQLFTALSYNKNSELIFKNARCKITCKGLVVTVDNAKSNKITHVNLAEMCTALSQNSESDNVRAKFMIQRQGDVMLVISSVGIEMSEKGKPEISSMEFSVFVK